MEERDRTNEREQYDKVKTERKREQNQERGKTKRVKKMCLRRIICMYQRKSWNVHGLIFCQVFFSCFLSVSKNNSFFWEGSSAMRNVKLLRQNFMSDINHHLRLRLVSRKLSRVSFAQMISRK